MSAAAGPLCVRPAEPREWSVQSGPSRTSAIVVRNLVRRRWGEVVLALRSFTLVAGETRVLGGLKPATRELLIGLLVGTLLPDEGEVEIFGTSTRAIDNETAWLAFLDQFGVVSERAVLLEGSSVAENLALPFALSPTPAAGLPDPHRDVRRLANIAELTDADLARPLGGASGLVRAKVRLARALALDPQILILEDPTAALAAGEALTLAEVTARARGGRSVVALSDDLTLARALGVRVELLDPAAGTIRRGWWNRLFLNWRLP